MNTSDPFIIDIAPEPHYVVTHLPSETVMLTTSSRALAVSYARHLNTEIVKHSPEEN